MKKTMIVTAALCVAVLSAPAVTKVQFWFDTEDYTYEPSNDCILRLATILTEEGVRGQFNIAGYLAQFIQANGRRDVIDALKPHCLGIQTMWHSRHPVIGEYCDVADYWTAYRRCMKEEAEAAGMVKAVFNRDRMLFAVQPGINSVYVGYDVYTDMGIPTGVVYDFDDGRHGMHWYCNQLQVQYNADKYGLSLERLLEDDCTVEKYLSNLDKLTNFDHITISMHPHMAIRRNHWDVDNFMGGNPPEFGKWVTPELLDPKVTERLRYQFWTFRYE